jgi:periplasmic protein TonB
VPAKRNFALLEPRYREESGPGIGLLVSIVVHAVLIATVALSTTPVEEPVEEPLTWVDLTPAVPPQPVPQMPEAAAQRIFTEAPGPAVDRAPSDAPFSDANRRASIPSPTGDQPTTRPGLTDAPYIPGAAAPGEPAPPVPGSEGTPGPSADSSDPHEEPTPGERGRASELAFAEPVRQTRPAEAGSPAVDWTTAIQEAGKVASLGGPFPGTFGGEEGFAESGPVSFETQWYEWGEYANSMVRRIRYHWFNNMPALVRMGVKGVVRIRFTIERDGRITDITILSSSGHPPYDFAARKALELSSPLQPLPNDFPKDSERVTASFFYNMRAE